MGDTRKRYSDVEDAATEIKDAARERFFGKPRREIMRLRNEALAAGDILGFKAVTLALTVDAIRRGL